MAWSIEGDYFENCSCEVVCPCTASLALGADNDYCRVVLCFRVDSGEVDGTDVSGLGVAMVAESGRYMHEGNWKLGLLIDDSASDEQAEKLQAVFSGQLGGPTGALSGLVGEVLGVERVPFDFSSADGQHRLRIEGHGEAAVTDVVPFGVEDGQPAKLTGIFHPAGSELNIAKADEGSGVEAFGISFGGGGKSAFSHRFAWSA
ncbi:MAG TPA: DUF1326 domain-containing protein [Solirubrobacteraceae bacterium]|nr:DUF1326 domain-containing protein [Solirubrobacteraceae bacterium]